ncbi:MAG: hypothetical protein EOO14_19680, partial [Chitinophagaceae bacterium]
MREKNITLLRKEIEAHFGRKVLSNKECIELSKDIFTKSGLLVSVTTLRRFFGLIKSDHLPSYTTLNHLAVYCGHRSYDDLEPLQSAGEPNPEESKLVRYIVSLFTNTVTDDVHDPTYLSLVRHTILFLNGQPLLMDAFQRAIAKTKNGQTFYFERFINVDKLNGYFGRGLEYYLAEKKTKEAQIFGHALLALRYWLSKKDDLFLLHAQELLSYGLDRAIHPFVCGRYYGTKLLKACLAKEPTG